MGIRIFLPAVYRLSEQTFDQTNGTILQRLYPAGWLSRFIPILTKVIWLIVIIMLVYFIFTAKTADKAIIMKGKNGKILSLDGNQVNLTVETDTHYEIL